MDNVTAIVLAVVVWGIVINYSLKTGIRDMNNKMNKITKLLEEIRDNMKSPQADPK